MKKILQILFLIIFSSLYCQHIRIVYEVKKIEKDTITNYYNLDILGNKSFFYESSRISKDSLFLSSSFIIEKDYKTQQIKNYEYFKENLFNYIEKNDIVFNILDNNSEDDLKMATCKLFDDIWTIKFNDKQNIIDGPYKFWGLPGLIYKISNSKSTFQINLIEIQKLNMNPNFSFLKKSREISKKKFLDTKRTNDKNEILLNDFSQMNIDKDGLNTLKEMLQKSSKYNLFNFFE